LTIIHEIDARSTREVLAAVPPGAIHEALHVDHTEVITRGPSSMQSYWSAQALINGTVHYGQGGSYAEALVACGVDADVSGRVKELAAEPSPVDRILAALAEWCVEHPYGRPSSSMLKVALLAATGMDAAEAVERAQYDAFSDEIRSAGRKADHLIAEAGRAICAREQVEVEDADELAAVAR
jgi:hypothetical protein